MKKLTKQQKDHTLRMAINKLGTLKSPVMKCDIGLSIIMINEIQQELKYILTQ